MILSETIRKSILELQKKYPQKRSALIPALHIAQTEKGYLPIEIQKEVAALFELDENEVHSVVTFYDMFFEKPVGKHLIHLCKNASCMLRGSDEILDSLCHHLNTSPGEITEDGEFTLIESECLGACDKAPMLLMDDQVIGPVKESDLAKIIEEAKKRAGHPCPVELVGGHHG
jgi:NADH-quinone oxidoreductase subunit E